jgi:predicted nucleic acid-binding protein
MILCIDSNVIIWGIKKQATSGQESLVEQAEYFFQWVDENEHQIIIPTVALAEILAREPEDIRVKYMDVLSSSFHIVDFDSRAALKYAQILYNRFEAVKATAASVGVDRQKMKMDHVIIACAIVHGAKCIYSYDRGLEAFATGWIEVRKFPSRPAPVIDLFSSFLSAEATPTPQKEVVLKSEESETKQIVESDHPGEITESIPEDLSQPEIKENGKSDEEVDKAVS